uniref:Uncharacterized protein n=1 Tax=Tetranychus urticae TaxID=32264 RepID=T1JWE5_TETUR
MTALNYAEAKNDHKGEKLLTLSNEHKVEIDARELQCQEAHQLYPVLIAMKRKAITVLIKTVIIRYTWMAKRVAFLTNSGQSDSFDIKEKDLKVNSARDYSSIRLFTNDSI